MSILDYIKKGLNFLNDNKEEIGKIYELTDTMRQKPQSNGLSGNRNKNSADAEDVEYEEVEESSKQQSGKRNGGKIGQVKDKMSDKEEDEFIDSLTNISEGELKSPAAVVKTLKNLIDASQEVIKFQEVQETKREAIRAQRDCHIRKIEAMQSLVSEYLTKTFDERSKIFAKQFEIVDHALINGNNKELSIALTNIQQLAQSSPFKALTDAAQIQKNLGDPNFEFDI